MKREFTRSRSLPAFRFDIPDLGLLWSRCLALFEASDRIHTTLALELREETLKFSSFKELEDIAGLPDQITNLSRWVSQGNRHISLRSLMLLGN